MHRVRPLSAVGVLLVHLVLLPLAPRPLAAAPVSGTFRATQDTFVGKRVLRGVAPLLAVSDRYTTLIQFDLTSLPADATLVAATLRVQLVRMKRGGSFHVGLVKTL